MFYSSKFIIFQWLYKFIFIKKPTVVSESPDSQYEIDLPVGYNNQHRTNNQYENVETTEEYMQKAEKNNDKTNNVKC